MSEFDQALENFSRACEAAAKWKEFYGATYRTRLDTAFAVVTEQYRAACAADLESRTYLRIPPELRTDDDAREAEIRRFNLPPTDNHWSFLLRRLDAERAERDTLAATLQEVVAERDRLARTLQSLFDFVWENVRDCRDIEGNDAQEKLAELGLIKLGAGCRPADEMNEWDADELYYPVPITGSTPGSDQP